MCHNSKLNKLVEPKLYIFQLNSDIYDIIIIQEYGQFDTNKNF